MNAEHIKRSLKKLHSREGVQDLFISLNFDYSKNYDMNLLDDYIGSKLKEKVDQINLINEYKQFKVFFCKLEAENILRNRTVHREIAKKLCAKEDCMIVFSNKHEDFFRIVYPYIHDNNNISLTGYTISEYEKLRTASEQLSKIEIESDIVLTELKKKIKDAFDIEPVTEKFFEVIKDHVEAMTNKYTQHFDNRQKSKAFALQFFNRLLFLKYIEKKRWLEGDVDYLSKLLDRYSEQTRENQSIYLDLLLPLFFYAFSKNSDFYPDNLPKTMVQEMEELPFLNGGLFEKNNLDVDGLVIDNKTIVNIFNDILNKYNFTVTEDTPFDREIAIDPEMLGLIYEGIVNEDERSGSGIFYTPRVEVDFMCKKSILHYLSNHTSIAKDQLVELIFSTVAEVKEKSINNILNFKQKQLIPALLSDMKVADPACGSGAFLIGILQNVLDILIKVDDIDLDEIYVTNPQYLYNAKKDLIERVIYGVDIKPWAIQLR